MACDGNIATEEIAMIKAIAIQTSLFEELDVENILNTYITAINQNGILFLRSYLNELSEEDLTPNEELVLIDLAIKMIEADNCIEYSEIKFFKKIRSRLSVSDKQILEKHPNKEDFLLPDINVSEVPTWDENIMFATISLS